MDLLPLFNVVALDSQFVLFLFRENQWLLILLATDMVDIFLVWKTESRQNTPLSL